MRLLPSLFRSLLAAAALVVAASVAPAQNPELDAGRKRVEDLRARAKQVREQGSVEDAKEIAEQARALEERLGRAAEHTERDVIMEGLERGMHALRELGRPDALEMLEKIAVEVRQQRERERGERRAAPRDKHPEIRAAREQLEVFRAAHAGLEAAGRGDSAELMELAARSLALRIENVRNEEAEAIHRKAPDHAQTTELLGFAAKLMRERRDERANMVANLAERFGERYRRAEQREAGADDQRRAAQEFERMQAEMKKLQAAMEDLRRRMEELHGRLAPRRTVR